MEVDKLLTVSNYADKFRVTRAYIYKLLKEKKMNAISIDGVLFIDTAKFPNLPNR